MYYNECPFVSSAFDTVIVDVSYRICSVRPRMNEMKPAPLLFVRDRRPAAPDDVDVAAVVVGEPPVVNAGVVTPGVTVVEGPSVVAVDSLVVVFSVDTAVVAVVVVGVVAAVLPPASAMVEVAEVVGLFKTKSV